MRMAMTATWTVVAGSVLLVTGCASAPQEPAPTTPPPPSATPSATATPTPTPSCGSSNAEEALAQAADELPPPFAQPEMSDFAWSSELGSLDGYDPCAVLSWIIVGIEGPTASSPYAIALFTYGELIGPATEQSYGFTPDVSPVDDVTIEVTYRWPQEGDTNAGPTGESVAQFRLDVDTGEIEMSGELPPM